LKVKPAVLGDQVIVAVVVKDPGSLGVGARRNHQVRRGDSVVASPSQLTLRLDREA
jgi:hypothetical protein